MPRWSSDICTTWRHLCSCTSLQAWKGRCSSGRAYRPENQKASPDTELNDNFDTENESQDETTTDHELLDPEDDSDSSQTTEQPRGAQHGSSDTTQTHQDKASESLKFKIAQVVTFTDNDSGQAHTGKILSRAGKATGTHKNWYNLQNTGPEEITGTTGSVNFEQVNDLQIVTAEQAELCTDSHKDQNACCK